LNYSFCCWANGKPVQNVTKLNGVIPSLSLKW
jgi:hypothetical protein